jgi:hypothetical protein
MWGTCTEIGVQLVPQGNRIVRLGIVNVVAGFWEKAPSELVNRIRPISIFLISGSLSLVGLFQI